MVPFAYMFMKDPIHGAQTSLYCALSTKLNGVGGKYYSDCAEAKPIPAALSVEDAKALWLASEKLVGL